MLTELKVVGKDDYGVFFEAFCHNDEGSFKKIIKISSLKFGDLAQVEALVGQTLEGLATVISGCFHPDSNAPKIIKEAFGEDATDDEIFFHLSINGILVVVNKSTCDQIVERWWNNYRLMRE